MKTIDEVIASSKNKKKVKDFLNDIIRMRNEHVSYKDIVAYLADRNVFTKEKSLITIVSNAKKQLPKEVATKEVDKTNIKKGGTKKGSNKVPITKKVIVNDEIVDEVIVNDEIVDEVIVNDEIVDEVIVNDEIVDEVKISTKEHPFYFNGKIYKTLRDKTQARANEAKKLFKDRSFDKKKTYLKNGETSEQIANRLTEDNKFTQDVWYDNLTIKQIAVELYILLKSY